MLSIQQLFNPLGDEKYKVITFQKELNLQLQKKVLPYAPDLLELRMLCARNVLHLRGVIKAPEEKRKGFKIHDIYFDMALLKERVEADLVTLRIREFKLFNPGRRWDIIKIANKYSNRLRHMVLREFTSEKSPFYWEEGSEVLRFDLNYVLRAIPVEMNLLGEIRIINLSFEPKQISWYLESNLFLRSLLDSMGPHYVEVEKIDLAQDAIRLLTDFPFDSLRDKT